jgi:hypothetical protein
MNIIELVKVKQRSISPRKISKYIGLSDLSKTKDQSDRKFRVKHLDKNKALEDLRYQVLSFKFLLIANDGTLTIT